MVCLKQQKDWNIFQAGFNVADKKAKTEGVKHGTNETEPCSIKNKIRANYTIF